MVQNEVFHSLIQKFSALDSTLSLYYASHCTDPHISDLLQKSSSMIEKRILMNDFQRILVIFPGAFDVYEGSGGKDWFHVRYPDDMTISEYNQQIPARRKTFVERLDAWIEQNPSASNIPAKPLALFKKQGKNDNKIMKPTTLNKKFKMSDMKNTSEKFRFKSKDEAEEKDKSKGLTLLERIKRKEQLKKLETQAITPEQKYEDYLSGKLVHFYNILFQIYKKEANKNKSRTYSVKILSQTISDSLSHPLSETDIVNVLKLLSKKLTSRVDIVKYNEVDMLRISAMDRNEDLPLLK